MARNWQYPRWRRVLMQAAMWGILGVTVGGAALLDRHIHAERAVAMGALVDCGDIRLRLPRGWTIEESSRQPGMLTAADIGGAQAARTIYVTVATPEKSGLVRKLLSRREPSLEEPGVPFGHDGSTGTLYLWVGSLNEGFAQIPFLQVIATARLRGGPEVTIRLEQLGATGDRAMTGDVGADLVKQIAATIVLSDQTASGLEPQMNADERR